jgi:hypothetical protein
MSDERFSRRDFLKLAGVASVAGAVASCTPKLTPTQESSPTSEPSPTKQKRFENDFGIVEVQSTELSVPVGEKVKLPMYITSLKAYSFYGFFECFDANNKEEKILTRVRDDDGSNYSIKPGEKLQIILSDTEKLRNCSKGPGRFIIWMSDDSMINYLPLVISMTITLK